MKRRGTRKQKDEDAEAVVTGAGAKSHDSTTTKVTSRSLKALEPHNKNGVVEDAGIDIATGTRPKRKAAGRTDDTDAVTRSTRSRRCHTDSTTGTDTGSNNNTRGGGGRVGVGCGESGRGVGNAVSQRNQMPTKTKKRLQHYHNSNVVFSQSSSSSSSTDVAF